MCTFAFLRHIFYYFYLQYGDFFCDKGGSRKKFLDTKGGSIKCPAGGGIQTSPFRRGVTVPFPPHAHVSSMGVGQTERGREKVQKRRRRTKLDKLWGFGGWGSGGGE